MMTIRPSQFVAMSEAIKRDFDERITIRLLHSRPNQNLGDYEAALLFVKAAISRALLHGIKSEEALERYISASWMLGGPPEDVIEGLKVVLKNQALAQFYRATEALRYAKAQEGNGHG